MEFEGEFETHITVRAADHACVDALKGWAGRRHLKFHHIVLDRGLTPSQPMISRRGRGGLSGELAVADELRRRLAADGFAVSRIKIEAAPGNRDLPATDAEAVAHHRGRYFEHHIKLALDRDEDLAILTSLACEHDAHLSRNALRVRDDGRLERFVTQRCYAVGQPSARGRLDALLAALVEGRHAIISIEEEFVVHDSAPDVDAGWLDLSGVVS